MAKTDYNKIETTKVKVVDPTTEEITKKKSIVKGKEYSPGIVARAGKLFFGEGGFKGVADHLIYDVFIPSIQNTVSDLAVNAIQRAIFGEDAARYSRGRQNDYWYGSRMSVSRNRGGRGGYIDYDKKFDQQRNRYNRPDDLSNNVKVITFDTSDDANEVLSVMMDSIDQYGLVTVADFYELSDIPSKFTDHQFGWTNLEDVRIRPVRGGGFHIAFPPVKTV